MEEERYSVLYTNDYYCPDEVFTTESFKEAISVARRYNADRPNCAFIYHNISGVLMDADGNLCDE